MRRGTGRYLPRGSGDRSGTTLRQNHAVGTEGGGRTNHRTQVLRVGHAVERDEQRARVDARTRRIHHVHGLGLALGDIRQLGERRILVRLHFEHDALMVRRPGDAIHFQTVGLQQVQALCAGELDDLACTVIMLDTCRDIQLHAGDADAQRLQHGIAADDQIVRIGRELRGATAGCQSRICHLATVRRLLGLVCLVIHAILGFGRRPLAA